MAEKTEVVVIGGGAAGMMAAYTAARAGARVLLLEGTGRLGRKLRITGKGRCNVTNDCDINTFLANVMTNPRFLYTALNRFSTADTMAFFEAHGVPLKTERGQRVFPVSDKAADVVSALCDACHRAGVETVWEKAREIVSVNGKLTGVRTAEGFHRADAVILATGGRSYPLTGSDGSGYGLAASVGHTVTPLVPSLVPVVSRSPVCPALQGLSLRNVGFCVTEKKTGKRVYSDFGEMLFTHFGMSGPMILSATAHLHDMAPGKYEAHIDLKPALDEKTLDARLLSDFEKYRNKDFVNALSDLLPQKLIPAVIERSGIAPRAKVNAVTREERRALLAVLKDFTVSMDGFRPIEEAIVTCGGVNVKEVSPRTMESKCLPGLFFAGEVLDVDAYTGGFNLQIAFSTAVLAGENAAIVTASGGEV